MAVTKQQLAQWSREFAAKNPDKVSGAGSTAQNITTKKSSVTKEQLSQWSREFDKKEAQRQAEQEQNTRDKALQQYTERHISDMGEVDARNDTSLAGRALARQDLSVADATAPLKRGATGVSGKFPLDAGSSVGRKMAGAATEGSGSGPVRQMPEAAARALDMGQKWGVPAKSGNVLENVGSGAMAYGSGRAQELRASFAKDSVPDEFDRINQWMDTGDNKNLADAVRRVDNTHGAYTDADLIQKGGWTQAQIDEARKMNAALDAIPAWKRYARRAANTIGGIGDTVAAAPVLGAEYGVQAGKNIDATLKNWKQVEQEVKGDEHAQSLFDLLTDVDMDYNPTWPESRNRELISMGYNSKEIREMRQKLAGLEVSDGIDKNQSVGYQLYDRGQKLTAAAQSGLSPTQRAVAGAVTSAAENLAVAGVNPAAVLPILSAQGAAEAMGQSAEKGESAGKALGGGLAKFGAGWAINSVGAADLAKTMGSDYAKDTLAGQIADWVQGLAGSSELAKRYPAVAAAISGGIDNSMQAFAETYADMAIDAALGDSEAAKNLFSKDTFLTALESGLSGGASGALGGAVGSGLAKMNDGDASLLGQAEYYDRLDRMERAAARQKEWEARAAEPSQSATDSSADRALDGQDLSVADATAPLKRGATGVPGSSQLDAGSAAGREMAGLATEESGSGPAQQTLGAAARAQSATGVPGSSQLDAGSAAGREMAGDATEGSGSVNETAAKSENPAVRQFAEVAASNSLTGKTIGLFTPNAENRENRAAFEQAYGVTLPDTAAATRRMLQEIAAQQNVKSEAAPAAQSAELPGEAVDVPQTVQDTPAEIADVVPEMAAPGNVREATAAAAETDSYENAPLRETLGLRPEAPKTQREAEVQRALEGWRVTDKAAETISKNMPDRVDADRYAAAASPLYRLGRKGAATFAQALELAGSMSGTAADINYILSTDAGRTALEIAYTQGKGERILYAEKMAGLGGTLGSESTSGRGEVYAKGTMRQESDPASQIISLNAAATGTDAVLRDVLQNDRSIRAYVDTETARIFFGDSAQDIFGTVLHEDYHWYNALDAEGARTLQEHALEYLAKSSGYESLDEMIRAKLRDYSAQSLTYEQAAEELVADAWRGIFDSEESFRRWVTFQRGQAEKNAGKSGAIHKVMEQVRQMLDGLISRAKEVLTIDPDNRAALKAKRLAEAEKRTLQDEYFAHAEKAMDNLRTAKENAAALKTESAAEKKGMRFQLHEGKDSLVERMNKNLTQLEQMETVAVIKGTEVSFGTSRKENIANVAAYFDSLGNRVERSEFGTVELTAKGARTTIQHGNSAAKQAAVGAIPEIIKNGRQIGYEKNWQGRGYDTYVFAAPVEINGARLYESVIVNSYRHDNRRVFYVHEVCWTDGSYVTLNTQGLPIKKEDTATSLPKAMLSAFADTQEVSSKQSIAQTSDESKRTDEPVKKTTRFQLAEQADRDAKQNQQRQASRVLAEKAAAFDTLNQFFGLTKNTRLSDAALESLAIRWTKTNGSRADRTKLANETRALVEYLRSEGADMAKAQGLAETLAGEVLDEATYRNTELWDEYPDLHDLTYTVDKNGKAKAELVKRYGSWTEAVAEARRHGVKLRQAEGYRDGNPAEQYEAIVNDTRAVGGVKESAAALFRSAAQEAGVAGAAVMESTEWLDVLMNVHDTIKPKMMSRFADAAEYEDAKVELAGRIIGDIMSHPEMTDAEAVFEGILKHNREVAAMAAGSEERAAEVTKGLKSVQQAQRKAFADRMRENKRGQAVQEYAEATGETDETVLKTVGDMNERLTFLREEYERRLKAESQRLKLERQRMLDDITLKFAEKERRLNIENDFLAHEYAKEQMRADYAERQLVFQQDEIADWAAENQRKAAEWEQLQKERDEKAETLWKEYAEKAENVLTNRAVKNAKAEALAKEREKKARDGRKADELKRSIRNNAAQLNQMALRPKPGKYVQKSLIVQAAEVAKLADMAVLNNNAVAKLTALQDSIRRSGEMDAGIHTDWENSGVEKLIQTLRDDMNASKQAKLDRLRQQLEEAKALPDGDKAEQLRDRLRQRIRETENRTYLPMTVDQLRMLKAITAGTLHMIRTENKTLTLARAEEVDSMAMKAAHEVLNSEGNGFGEKFEKVKGAMNRYQLDMLGGTRMFRRLGGYTKNGQMEKLGQMLNDGQRRQTEILVEGESLFANVTGKEHLKEVEAFAGPGAELVDIGLKDSKGNAVPLNHAQLCSLYMLLRNEDSRHHLMTGGLTLPDAAQYAKGNIERAYQRSQTVMLGTLVNADGVPMADTILQTVQGAMTDYDRAWCEDMKDFFGRYTTNLINETSMKLLGYDRATVKNYYPIAVDRSTLATEIEGVKMDATIEGRGFLKERVKSDKPILLEECQNVVKRSLRDTADYAGLAAPIRDVQRVLNSTVETAEGVGVLKNKIIKDKWGEDAVSYIDELLTDLQQVKKISRKTFLTPMLTAGRGLYAGAVLTLNPGVAIAQAASLPTAGAVLGTDTMAAVLPFVKNFSGKQRAAVEAEIRQHGDALLQYRLRGTKQGELSSVGANMGLVKETMSKMPHLTGWITGMDEITVAALWEGAKRYVEHHAAEFGLTEENLSAAQPADGGAARSSPTEGSQESRNSEAYWEAVNKMYQRVIEETQPNYTAMQRAGIQRNDSDVVKTLTMFTTQRFQNYGILADAVGDYKAQKARYAADQSAENKAEVQRAKRDLGRALSSQAVQTAVFAAMKIISDFLLRRWDREQDENGDVTGWSLLKRYGVVCVQAVAGYAMGGSEIYSFVDNVIHDTDYDVISISNLAGANDAAEDAAKFSHELAKDTSEMDEEELEKHHGKLKKCALTVIKDSGTLVGLPAQNAFNLATAIWGWGENIVYSATKGEYGKAFSINGLPASATGQYDRLYNAIQSGDSEEAAAAMKKLEQMLKEGKVKELKVDSQLKTRLKKYDTDILEAAKAQNAGKEKAAETAREAAFRKLLEGLDVGSTDSARRAELANIVTGAVNEKANELLAAEKGRDKDASVYADLLEEVETGRAKDVQAEISRLLTAGKKKSSIKSKITEAVKEEYLAGSDGDRERLEKKLLALEDADGKPLYEEKNFAQWVKDADKKAEKVKDERNWWEEVK
ncbi:MAG: hypothetical protein ACLR29_08445 [Faecalibacterium prausnitzii]